MRGDDALLAIEAGAAAIVVCFSLIFFDKNFFKSF